AAAPTGLQGTGWDRGTWTSPADERTNKKTQLPELGFVHSSWGRRESDHQVAAETATCACSGGRGGNGGNHSCTHCPRERRQHHAHALGGSGASGEGGVGVRHEETQCT